MSARVRAATAKLRQSYATHWRIPLDSVKVEYRLTDQDEEQGVVWAEGYPKWSTG